MQSGGLVEVLNPSQVFLEERLDGATGFVHRGDYGRDASDFGGGSGLGNTDHVWKCQAYYDRT